MDVILKEEITKEMAAQIYQAYPFLWGKFGRNGYERTAEDNMHHLNHLELAYEMGDINLFLDYTKWLQGILTSRNVGTDLIVDNFNRLIEVIPEKTEQKEADAYLHCLNQAVLLLKR
ncbi:hypothetical protein D8M04_16240 [Oceanobacillus piezotolerans]|uniref:Uncharacterized protein n=1 Tax=Oceanobacillus piezotolerans TaxID=2448030 RepID=A0A498DAW6_9BACI|nr:hypothetical protein [Oceanobacillus piezotolerans]RLL42128.1 hypothetical protein D8M04_16240 [Oceanobacillus piezotolerans]